MECLELYHHWMTHEVLSAILPEVNPSLVENLHHSLILRVAIIEDRGHMLAHFVEVLLYNKCMIFAFIR